MTETLTLTPEEKRVLSRLATATDLGIKEHAQAILDAAESAPSSTIVRTCFDCGRELDPGTKHEPSPDGCRVVPVEEGSPPDA